LSFTTSERITGGNNSRTDAIFGFGIPTCSRKIYDYFISREAALKVIR
jgi:hypothetical protein